MIIIVIKIVYYMYLYVYYTNIICIRCMHMYIINTSYNLEVIGGIDTSNDFVKKIPSENL